MVPMVQTEESGKYKSMEYNIYEISYNFIFRQPALMNFIPIQNRANVFAERIGRIAERDNVE